MRKRSSSPRRRREGLKRFRCGLIPPQAPRRLQTPCQAPPRAAQRITNRLFRGGLEPGRYVVKLEVNSSFDYNDHYTKANSGVNGQPSIVYQTDVLIGAASSLVCSCPSNRLVDGSDGKIKPGLEGITTALQILGSAQIEYLGD